MRRPPHEEDVGAKRWNKRQQQSREERGSVDPESSSDTAAGRGSMDPARGAASSSDPGRGSMDPAPGKARKGQQAKAGREGIPSEPPQPEPADAENLRKSIDETERQQSPRRMEANETVEVDLRENTAKVHMEQQEALLRQTSSNPWFLFNQDVLALKDEGEEDLLRLRGCQGTRGCLEGHASPPTSSPWRCWSNEVVSAPLQRL